MKKLISFLVVCMMSLLQVTPVIATDFITLEDDYVVYIIDEKSVNEQGQIEIDGQKLADALRDKAWSKKPGSNWMPGDTSIGKVKFVNKLPYTIRFQDYSVKIPTYQDTEFIGNVQTLRTSLPTHGSTGLVARGKGILFLLD